MICVADGMVVPFADAAAAAVALTIEASVAAAVAFGVDAEPEEPLPPQAAIVRHAAASAGLKRLSVKVIESSWCVESSR
jgi:hypothetical protein